jgi:orotate phosphoribosyltransferase-like protein|tara:strand:- start:656 stop:901 length:246 start_codon:yes stop_codon:yes gene_type:complete
MQNNNSVKRNLGSKIHSLADKGLSYRQIEKKLGCSKGAISYHLGESQKDKAKARLQKQRDNNVRYETNRWQYLANNNQEVI